MARICDLCGKKPTTGHKVSHANNKTNRRWLPNLKSFRTLINGATKSLKLCTRCIRTQKLTKVVASAQKMKKAAAWTKTEAQKA